MTYRAGSKFDLNPTLSILAGYAYDEQFMPNRSIDLNTYDSEKHFVAGGVELKVPSAIGLWKLNLGGQVIFYMRTIWSAAAAPWVAWVQQRTLVYKVSG